MNKLTGEPITKPKTFSTASEVGLSMEMTRGWSLVWRVLERMGCVGPERMGTVEGEMGYDDNGPKVPG